VAQGPSSPRSVDDESRRYMRKYGFAAWQQWLAAGRPEPAPPEMRGDEARSSAGSIGDSPPAAAQPHPSTRLGATEALRAVLVAHYADFSGRASRSEYWWWFALMAGLSLGAYLLLFLMDVPGEVVLVVALASALVGLATIIPSVAVTVRRLHDQGRSGWWIVMALVPGVGWLLLLAAMVPDTEPRPNRWGSPPAGSVYADPATWESPEVS